MALRLQAYKFELRPTGEQRRQMRRFAGARRFVYNKALALQTENYASGGKFIGYVPMAKRLTEWRAAPETAWLADAPMHPLQQTLRDLDRAYRNFFAKRAELPEFKKKGRSRESFRYPDSKQFELDQLNCRIKLPKLGWLRYRNSRIVQGAPRNVTVSEAAGEWYISIQTRREVEQPIPAATAAVGIDMGIARFAALSDGSAIAPVSSFKRHEATLRRAQRALSHKVRFSKNWQKAKRRVGALHIRIANVRRDFLHKSSTTISKNHAMVAVEDLQIQNMSRSGRGKAGLNKAILDQGWSEFRRQLDYKLNWAGGILVAVPPHYTSQTCPACGHVAAGNRRTQAEFECLECGFAENADTVGAINVLARGHRVIACGEDLAWAASVKQEPTEASALCAAQ